MYSDDEKNEAVLRIVQGGPTFSRSSLATRRVDETYEQTAELIRSALFYEPDALYNLIYLSSNYYTRYVGMQLTVLDTLLDGIDDLLVRDIPVDDVSSLVTARRSLQDVSSALVRNGTVSTQAYSRYRKAIDRSREALGRPVKYTRVPRDSTASVTDIVRPRSEAKSIIRTNLASMQELHTTIVDGVDYLLEAVSDYNSSQFSTGVAKNQVDRAVDDLEDLSTELEALTPDARTAVARDSLIRVLSNRATVRALAESPGGATKLDGTTRYRASATGTGAVPELIGTAPAPWRTEDGAADTLEIDFSGTTVSVDLIPGTGFNPGVRKPEVIGSSYQNFQIGADLSIPYNLLTKEIPASSNYAVASTVLYIVVDGILSEVTFSSDMDADAVATRISTATGVTATKQTSGTEDWVRVVYNHSPAPALYKDRYVQIASGIDNANDLGPWRAEVGANPTATVSRGWDGNDELRIQANSETSVTTIPITPGSWPDYEVSASDVATDITTAGGTSFEGVAVSGKVKIISKLKGEGAGIRVRSEGLASGKMTPSLLALQTLGLSEYQDAAESDVPPQAVTVRLNQDSDFAAAATASLSRDVPVKELAATVTATDALTIPYIGETDDPSSGWTLSELKLTIGGGDNAGVYGITAASWSAPNLELTLDRTLRDQSADNRHIVTIASEKLKIVSKDSSVDAYIEVGTPATSAHSILGLDTTRTYGTVTKLFIEYNDPVSGWQPADISRLRIRVGDVVVDDSGSDVATITGISSASTGVLDVSAIAPTLSLSSFTIVSSASRQHASFDTALQSWRTALSPYVTVDRIDTLLAPLLLLDSPSSAQVNAAYTYVDAYKTKMESLDTVLRSFSIGVLPAIREVSQTLLEHGHDRARDLMLQGRFSDFFSTTARTASYSRMLIDAGSQVTVEDLNAPTKVRDEGAAEFDRLVAAWVEDEPTALENEEEIPDSPLEDYWPDL